MKIETTTEIINNNHTRNSSDCEIHNANKQWVAVNELIKHIEDSRSPDGEYPDSDCIIMYLKHITSNASKTDKEVE